MRLIDADKLEEYVLNSNYRMPTIPQNKQWDTIKILDAISNQPTAFDKEKVIEQLTDKIDPNIDVDTDKHCDNWVVDMENEIIGECINIVIKGGIT